MYVCIWQAVPLTSYIPVKQHLVQVSFNSCSLHSTSVFSIQLYLTVLKALKLLPTTNDKIPMFTDAI